MALASNSSGALAGAPARPVLAEKRSYSATSGQEAFIVPLLREAIEGALEKHARRGGRAIDVGCGGQPFRVAIESQGMAYHSMDAMPQAGVTTDFLCAIDGTLPEALLGAAPFDVVLCTEVLEHVADWPAAWVNLERLVAVGGTMIVTCPFVFPLHEEPYDFFRPTVHALRHWAGRAGLEVVEITPLGDAWDVLGTLAGACSPRPRAGAGVGAWIAHRIARWHRKAIQRACRGGFVRRRVALESSVYLSNVAVLRKPGAGSHAGGVA
jgi:hypothetical protein